MSHTPSRGNVILVRLLFYIGIIEWLIALATSSVGLTGPAVIAGGIAVVMMFLYFYFYTEEDDEMFGKRPEPTPTLPATPALPAEDRVEEKSVPVADTEIAGHTVIAKGVLFTGNIRAPGLIQVRGELQGNVDVQEGTVSVMRGGMVEGDVTCRRLMVNGRVSGNCRAGHVEIGEHGVISGTLLYTTLSIHTGGQICGESGLLTPEAAPAPAQDELPGQESEASPQPFSDQSPTGEDGADDDDDTRQP